MSAQYLSSFMLIWEVSNMFIVQEKDKLLDCCQLLAEVTVTDS